MPGQKAYPRATVKKIVKAHANCNVSKNVDVMVSEDNNKNATIPKIQRVALTSCLSQIYLDYVLFMQT